MLKKTCLSGVGFLIPTLSSTIAFAINFPTIQYNPHHSRKLYNIMKILKFEPIYMERVWGGRMLSDFFKRKINCKSDKIGESWEIVDRPNAQSVASEGIYKGQSIRNIILKHSKSILGPGWNPKKQFPILVKWLDCKERLSLQVHPPAHIAKDLNGEPLL